MPSNPQKKSPQNNTIEQETTARWVGGGGGRGERVRRSINDKGLRRKNKVLGISGGGLGSGMAGGFWGFGD
jgi:hypothetical protein